MQWRWWRRVVDRWKRMRLSMSLTSRDVARINLNHFGFELCYCTYMLLEVLIFFSVHCSNETTEMKLVNNNSLIILFLLLILAFTELSSLEEGYSRDDFPPGFVFGSGTSAYQVEGAAEEDGRTRSIWDVFAHAGHSGGATGDVACDQYHKYKEFGDRVLHWTTINEANVFALGGYDQGVTPPGRCSLPFGLNCSEGNSPTEPYIAVHNMLLAHASATNLYKKQYQHKQHGSVGISICTYGAAPLSNSTEDKQATARVNDFFIGWVLHPLVFGDYPETMKTRVGSRLPAFTEDESDQVKGAIDFVGVINYMAVYVKDNSSSLKQNLRDFNIDMAVELTLVGNTSFNNEFANTPWSLQQVLLYIKENYGNPPIYIAENGQMTPQSSSLEDTSRIKYLSSHIEAVLHSLSRKGANVRGYFQWSLMDLYEVFGGYNMSYGLYYVDFKDPYLNRYPKLSAHWYSSFLGGRLHHRSHALSSAI
ncbi:unnamed protein product [Brassica napus]|uniref:thioglucosidase n=1 Tax=Brassica napus TaxID=3708 RepID=A0A817AU03_BRANA|nr:unnamed protein product [Brassica napus]